MESPPSYTEPGRTADSAYKLWAPARNLLRMDAAKDTLGLPPSGFAAKGDAIRSEFLKSRVAFARIEAEILSRHKELKERDLDPETIKSKAPEYADDYVQAWTRRNAAQAAYEAVDGPSPTSRGVKTLGPTGPTTSTLFKGLVAGRKRTTHKLRKSRKHGSSRVLRRTRRRVSRRKVPA